MRTPASESRPRPGHGRLRSGAGRPHKTACDKAQTGRKGAEFLYDKAPPVAPAAVGGRVAPEKGGKVALCHWVRRAVRMDRRMCFDAHLSNSTIRPGPLRVGQDDHYSWAMT